MKRLRTCAIAAGAVAISAFGTAAVAETTAAKSQPPLIRSVERGADTYRETVRTPPGHEPQVSVTVEQKNWAGYRQAQLQQMKALHERALRAEARVEALEQQLAQAERDDLDAVADVRQDERGTVITLAGAVLFPFDSSELLPSAQRRLDTVARALKSQQGAHLTVVGHTDALGSEQYNEALATRRADAVASYLISRGLTLGSVAVVGVGESDPVATNATPEGRANNRRVEVILPNQGDAIGGSGRGQ